MFNAIHIPAAEIYDIFQRDNRIIAIGTGNKNVQLTALIDGEPNEFTPIYCPHGHTAIHTLILPTTSSPLTSLKLRVSVKQPPPADASVAPQYNVIEVDTSINHYPSLEGAILMETQVKNEDSYIVQWIEYHLALGFTHFCIYDNAGSPHTRYTSAEKTSNLSTLLKPYIERGVVLLIKWPYPKYIRQYGNSGQTTAQTHSIHAFNQAKYIGLFDVDEYINPQKEERNIERLVDKLVGNQRENIGGIFLNCRLFFNLNDYPEGGYDFLRIPDCTPILRTRYRKCIVIPKNVETYSVHMPSLSKRMAGNMRNFAGDVIFNHYFFLNKAGRGRKKSSAGDTNLSIIRHLDFIPKETA